MTLHTAIDMLINDSGVLTDGVLIPHEAWKNFILAVEKCRKPSNKLPTHDDPGEVIRKK